MTDIYLTISVSTYNGDDTPQNPQRVFGGSESIDDLLCSYSYGVFQLFVTLWQ